MKSNGKNLIHTAGKHETTYFQNPLSNEIPLPKLPNIFN
jgi:hypothetical protein